jgi:hypothetical protein
MGIVGIFKRIRELWLEHIVAFLLAVILFCGIFWSPWAGVAFTALCFGFFIWYLTTLWKGGI